nr:MAG: ORF1 [Torque teno midi virus]
MPFWWRRRKRNWYGKFRRPYRRRRWPKRRRRRIYKRRRASKPYRRRRRRRHKVRRKKQKLNVYQWQPDSIRKCKIKGIDSFLLGAEGTQMYCYTTEKTEYIPPKVPWGGGFATQDFTLKLLYEEYQFTNNIWTASNILKDLCRFLYCKIQLYRHPDTDFVVSYNRQGPFDLTKFTFPGCHPQQIMLQKHKRLVFSLSSKPHGKYFVQLKLKPPKQMISKWFFSKEFAPKILFNLKAAAANLRYSYLSASNENMQVTIYSLNTKYYQDPSWGQTITSGPYKPYQNMQLPQKYKVLQRDGTLSTVIEGKINERSTYGDSISYTIGWFNNEFLRAKELDNNKGTTLAVHQAIAGRYNPMKDNGFGNEIYCVAITSHTWDPPQRDKMLYIAGMPLWLGLFGYISWIKKTKPLSFLGLHVIVLKSPAIYCYPEIGGCGIYCPIDWDYMQGKKPYDQTITPKEKLQWFPTIYWQLKTLNAIVQTGPFVPQYSEEKNSTWELKLGYEFYFKWGGPHTGDPEITNPEQLQTYDVPDKMQQTVQIANPEKISPETVMHPWDWRRGFIKERALKRMCDNFETDTEFQCSPEKISKKTQRLGGAPRCPQEETQELEACLQELYKENICQDSEEKTLQQLIEQQQLQQQELKRNILMLLMDLKNKQRMIQLQTGMLE